MKIQTHTEQTSPPSHMTQSEFLNRKKILTWVSQVHPCAPQLLSLFLHFSSLLNLEKTKAAAGACFITKAATRAKQEG